MISTTRGLSVTETPRIEYLPPNEAGAVNSTGGNRMVASKPSFNFGWNSIAGSTFSQSADPKAESPMKVLRDPVLLTFVLITFLFQTANGTVLPLVMQTLALGGGSSGILLSGLCIIVAQLLMVVSARLCGEFSGQYGRKPLFLVGLFTAPVRCLILTALIKVRGDTAASSLMQVATLSTQILDGVGAGVFGTMYILVTSDLSQGTGRFSLILGLTTAAMSIGGTISGYLGEALAQDLGYEQAFFILMLLSLVPAVLYLTFMPETLITKPPQAEKITSIREEEEESDDREERYSALV
jgi:MFS family permease